MQQKLWKEYSEPPIFKEISVKFSAFKSGWTALERIIHREK